jgi:transposase-like protein
VAEGDVASAAAAAWLVLAVGDDRQHGVMMAMMTSRTCTTTGTVRLAITRRFELGTESSFWDKKALLGASVIEEISVGSQEKILWRCPKCKLAAIKARKGVFPRYKCYKCKAEFDDPLSRLAKVRTYRTRHDAGWVDLEGVLAGMHLRQVSERLRHNWVCGGRIGISS